MHIINIIYKCMWCAPLALGNKIETFAFFSSLYYYFTFKLQPSTKQKQVNWFNVVC